MPFLTRLLKHNNLSKGKVGLYLLYALGEIILVVVGILIAVNIDQSNKEAEEQKLQLKYYSEIIVDLEKDSIHFNQLLNSFKTHLINYYKVYDETNGIHRHENPKDFDYLLYDRTFAPATLINQQLTIEKLDDTKIRSLLNNYFQEQRQVSEAIDEFNLEITQNSRTFFINNDAFNAESIFQADKFDFLSDQPILKLDTFHELVTTDKFLRILVKLRISGGYTVFALRRAMEENQKLLIELKSQLNN